MASRKAYIDAAKFLGIFLVLMNHIGLIVPFVNFYGGMFYVPVFFVAAGMTFHNKEEGLLVFAGKKAKRLLVPYFVCNGFLYTFFLGKSFLASQGIGKELLTALIGIFYSRNSLYIPGCEPNVSFMTILNSPAWFLTAIFLTYVLLKYSFLITKGSKKKLVLFTICMLFAGIGLHYVCPVLLPWSLECVPLFYCYIIAGYFIVEEKLLERKKLLYPFLAAGTPLFVLFCHINGSANISVGMFGKSVVLGLFNGIFSSFLILLLCKAGETCLPKSLIKFFSGLGSCTLPVLCYHMFVFALIKSGISIIWPVSVRHKGIVEGAIKFACILMTIGIIVSLDRIFDKMRQRGRKR